jgi:hypothetical protein
MDKYTMDTKTQIIRGQRILNQLEENELKLVTERSTIDQLATNTKGFMPQTRKREYAMHELGIPNQPIYKPAVGTKTLTIKTDVSSRHESKEDLADPQKRGTNPIYTTTIIFNQVEYENESTDTNVTFTGADGQEYNMAPIQLNKHTVRVACNCLDFHWRFRSYNAQDQSSAIRGPAPYKKVPGSTRPPSNIKRVPGLCKHLLATIEALKNAKMVT